MSGSFYATVMSNIVKHLDHLAALNKELTFGLIAECLLFNQPITVHVY